MPKILVVIGATGVQGGSVVRALLQQNTYKIRAITRNPASEKARALSTLGVELVTADLNNKQSFLAAFIGATAIFAVTNFYDTFGADDATTCMDKEYIQGTNMARAASQTPTLEHYIWSTLPDPALISCEQKWLVPHFTGKGRVDEFIKKDPSLLSKTTFLWVVYYGSNFQYPIFTPSLLVSSLSFEGLHYHYLYLHALRSTVRTDCFLPNWQKTTSKYIHFMPCAPDTPISSVGVPERNVGVLARVILAQPQLTLGGKYVYGKVDVLTTGDFLKLWEDVTGKNAAYVQVTPEAYRTLWGPLWGDEVAVMLRWWEHEKINGYTVADGSVVLEPADLGLKREDLGDTREAMAAIDWAVVLGE